MLLAGIGSLSDVEVGTHVTEGTYRKHAFPGPVELLSLAGVITGKSSTGPYQSHLHASIADLHGQAWGGHLFGATVAATAEVVLQPLIDSRLKRAHHPEFGVDLLDF